MNHGRPHTSVTHCAHCGELVLTSMAVQMMHELRGGLTLTLRELRHQSGMSHRNMRITVKRFDDLFAFGPWRRERTRKTKDGEMILGSLQRTYRLSVYGREVAKRLATQREKEAAE